MQFQVYRRSNHGSTDNRYASPMDWSAYQICKSKFCIRVRWLKIQLYWKVDFLSWSWSDPMVMWLLKMVKMDQMRQFFKRDKNLDVRRTNRFAFNRNKRHYLKDTCHFTIKPKFKWSISTNPAHFKGCYRVLSTQPRVQMGLSFFL